MKAFCFGPGELYTVEREVRREPDGLTHVYITRRLTGHVQNAKVVLREECADDTIAGEDGCGTTE